MKRLFCSFVVLFFLVCLASGCAAPPSCNAVSGGPGTASISFTSVPSLGSTNNLKGRVLHVAPAGYYVAVYIYVDGWWTKPYFDSPQTSIDCDGTFSTDITTGGDDQEATAITAFLLPEGYTPPLLSGEATLPESLYSAAAATASASR
ncbi:MAG: hypothetical protein WBE72_03225 [Terracidiphilus sp.]